MAERRDVLPLSCPPRGLSRVEAAAYVNVSPAFFDQLVKEGMMPKPKRVAFFMKQMTGKRPIPADLLVRQFPTSAAA